MLRVFKLCADVKRVTRGVEAQRHRFSQDHISTAEQSIFSILIKSSRVSLTGKMSGARYKHLDSFNTKTEPDFVLFVDELTLFLKIII